MSCKKGVLKNFAKFTEKHLCWSLFFNHVAELRSAYFFIEHLLWLLLLVTIVFCDSHLSVANVLIRQTPLFAITLLPPLLLQSWHSVLRWLGTSGFKFLPDESLIVNHRSNHRRCSVKKGGLKNFLKFTGKHLCQSLFFNKVAF